ncbi:PRAME family member 25-like [Grammomys surdaster]|uniref:PRAME family member 25-like n=1 Tax=Grammomys surdaster TaxID=491861 RepID=UPI0010A03D52|nr:PRAME family member 25-like [Grammomys surdaster]
MSTYNPPAFRHLALEQLLKNDAIDFSDLENLPDMLFPHLFKEAFNGRHTEILKGMVVAWPFPYLPVGPLLKPDNVEMMQAVLAGIDKLLTENNLLKGKLQVLDFRDVHQDFWDIWAGREDGVCSADILSKKQVPESIPALRQPLQVVTNLSLFFSLNKHQKCLLQWAQKSKDYSVQLICLKMTIFDLPPEIIIEVLNIFQPNYIEELEVHTKQVLSFLCFFAPFLGQMRHLLKFDLNQIDFEFSVVDTMTDAKKCAAKFLSQFSKLNHLRHLYMNGAYFSYDNMKELFR